MHSTARMILLPMMMILHHREPIIGLPKSFKIYKAIDYLYPNGEPDNPEDVLYDEYFVECDEGEDASIVFKYNESATGVYVVYNSTVNALNLWLSPWAVEADVLLYVAFINAILKKHPRTKLYDKYDIIKNLTDIELNRMLADRRKYLKRLLQTKDGFTMEGINDDFTLQVADLPKAASIDMQVTELQQVFTKMQWDEDEV